MRVRLLSLCAFMMLLNTHAQERHGIGVEFGGNYNFFTLRTDLQSVPEFDVTDGLYGISLSFQYDYKLNEWLGLNSGLGVVTLGGEDRLSQQQFKYQALSLALPIIAQFKTGEVFWWELGASLRFGLTSINSSDPRVGEMELKAIELVPVTGFRINLSSKLSIASHIGWGISPIATLSAGFNNITVTPFENEYLSRSIALSARYMFKDFR